MDERTHVGEVALSQILLKLDELGSRLNRLESDKTETRQSRPETRLFEFHTSADEYHLDQRAGDRKLVRTVRPALPDPRLIRRIIRNRQSRANFFNKFGKDIFGDPAWDMLLDLAVARAEHTRVSVTSLCIASGVPPTTALRWISLMVDEGLFVRVDDESDKRRAFIALSDKAADIMASYFVSIGKNAVWLV